MDTNRLDHELIRTQVASDGSLLAQLREGSTHAATDLYHRYARRLRALAEAQSSPQLTIRVDAEDIVQSVFRTFFRRAVENQYAVPDGEDLWKLLLVIALRKIRNAAVHHSAAKRDHRMTVSLNNTVEDHGSTPDETSVTVLKMTLAEVLADFPESSRAMITLRIEGHEVGEIAQQTRRSKRSVERVLQQFRAQMRQLLDEVEGSSDESNSASRMAPD